MDDWRKSRFTRHHNLLPSAEPITGPIVKNGGGRTAGKKVGRVVGGVELVGSATSTAVTTDLSGLGIQSGDFLLLLFQRTSSGDEAQSVVTAGWTKDVELFADDSWDSNLMVASKVADGTETSVQVGAGTYTPLTIVQVWRGVSGYNVTTTTATGINSNLPNPPSITPVSDGAIIVVAGGGSRFGTIGAYINAEPTGFQQITNPSGSVSGRLGVGYYLNRTPEAFDPAAYTGGTGDPGSAWCAATIALK